MALRNQPYLPLYVNDFLSDEKLNNCSAESTGIYIRLMCLMHKSENYGVFELRERDKIKYKSQANLKQSQSNHAQIFSERLRRFMPYGVDEIERGLEELAAEGVIQMDEDRIWQPRMVRDGQLSEIRAKAGSAGGKAARNLGAKKNYNEPGYLYIAEDCNDAMCHKVGITKDLRNRLNGLRRQSRREMKFVFTAEVNDMGTVEDNVLTLLNDIRDGEWIYGQPISSIMKAVNLSIKIASKPQANSENEDEDVYISETEFSSNKKDRSVSTSNSCISELQADESKAEIMSFYMDRVNASPSQQTVSQLLAFADILDADVVIHAMEIALDERKASWSYIKAILKRYERDGLTTMEAVLQSEADYDQSKSGSPVMDGGKKTLTFYDVAEQMKARGEA